MKKEIKFSLVYRDMWQSSGKYQPRADQLARIAPLIIEMGCLLLFPTFVDDFNKLLIESEKVHLKPNERLTFTNKEKKNINIIFRVSNNDIAFRYEMPKYNDFFKQIKPRC